MHSRCCWPPESANADCLSLPLTSSQSAALTQRLLDDVVEALAPAVDARAERDVVVDRLRERVRLLEHHADAAAHLDRVDARRRRGRGRGTRCDPTPAAPAIEIVHAVERAQERALAAARRTDQRGDPSCRCTSSVTPSTATRVEVADADVAQPRNDLGARARRCDVVGRAVGGIVRASCRSGRSLRSDAHRRHRHCFTLFG